MGPRSHPIGHPEFMVPVTSHRATHHISTSLRRRTWEGLRRAQGEVILHQDRLLAGALLDAWHGDKHAPGGLDLAIKGGAPGAAEALASVLGAERPTKHRAAEPAMLRPRSSG